MLLPTEFLSTQGGTMQTNLGNISIELFLKIDLKFATSKVVYILPVLFGIIMVSV